MKKENIAGLIVYIVILALAIVFGLTILKQYFADAGDRALEGWQFALFILGAVLAGAVVNATIFEIAHIIGAKAGGYKIVSVCILGLTFYKEDGKTKIRFAQYDGLTGETKITPKKGLKKEANPTLYLLLGSLLFVIELLAAIIVFAYITSKTGGDKKWAYFILTAAIVGAMILLYNILPLRLDSMTDGYRLRQCSGQKNRKAFNNLLRMENGEKVEEGETEAIELSAFSNDIKLNHLYELLNTRDYVGAEKVLDEEIISDPKVSKNVYLRARAQKIYINLMTKSLEDSMMFYDEEVSLQERRAISDDGSMDCIRAYVLMSGLLDKSRSECNLALKKLLRAYKAVPDARKDLERKLFNEGLQKVIDAHPTWELEQFLIKEPESK